MNTRLLSAIALAATLAVSGAYAQETMPKPASAPKVTKEEREAASAKRKEAVKKEGTQPMGDATAPATAASKVSKAEREAARAKRKAETASAVKKGELAPMGDAPKK